jgi:hypothetical protein
MGPLGPSMQRGVARPRTAPRRNEEGRIELRRSAPEYGSILGRFIGKTPTLTAALDQANIDLHKTTLSSDVLTAGDCSGSYGPLSACWDLKAPSCAHPIGNLTGTPDLRSPDR